MDGTILSIAGVSKAYKEKKVLDNINLKIKKREIYGLVGNNGAGKTTLMRIIAGLVSSYDGEVTQSNNDKIGFLIEEPSIVPFLTPYENLYLQSKIKGVDSKDIDDILELIGLKDCNKIAKKLSLGMKQRLGIGIALVGKPSIVILDEPINGLDPQGIIDIRKLINNLNSNEGITFVISSHNLEELYQVATRYIFINNGKIKEEITLDALKNKLEQCVLIKVDGINQKKYEDILTLFEHSHIEIKKVKLDDGYIKIYSQNADLGLLSELLYKNGYIITHISMKEDNLEQYFLGKVGDSDDGITKN